MSLARKVLSSSSLLVGIKAFQRLVGLISIVILARLLSPDDFAIVALVAIIVHFFDILSNAGSEQYIIQKEQVSIADLNTAWSLDISIKGFIWALLFFGSHSLSAFFNQPDLEDALQVASIILIINALKNPGLFLLKQELEYRKIFWLSVVQRIGTFLLVIPLALVTQSYWALIIGDIFASIVFTFGSYRIHQLRPKFSLANFAVQWDFSKWLLLKGVVGYTRSQIDTLIVSKFHPAAALGQYYMARNIAMIPSHNLLAPAIEPLLAAFSSSKSEDSSLAAKIELCLYATTLISAPIFVFILSFPEPIIDTLLGDQWHSSGDLLGVLAILFLYFSYVQILEQSLVATGRTKSLFYYDVASLLFISATLLGIAGTVSIVELGLTRGMLGLATMLALLIYVRSIFGIRLIRIIGLSVPVFLIASMAYLATDSFSYVMSNMSLAILIQMLIIFSTTYIFLIFILHRFILTKVNEIKKLNSYFEDLPFMTARKI